MENLEEKIQEVLKTETNYNFALTVDRRKIMSREPPSNLGMAGPGPAAYRHQSAGLKFRMKTKQDPSWKMRQTIDDEFNEADATQAEPSECSVSESSESESSDSDNESGDDNGEKKTER